MFHDSNNHILIFENSSILGIMDIQVMLFVGFGFLMTFLPRFGYSAVCFTMIITVCCVEWGILVTGFLNMEHETMTIHITWLRFVQISHDRLFCKKLAEVK